MTDLQAPDIETRNYRTGEPSALRIYHHSPHSRKYDGCHDSIIVTAAREWQSDSTRGRIVTVYRLMRTAGVTACLARTAIYETLFASTMATGVLYETTDGVQR
jgi:hypothetical protein